jgi:hypothetical protein
MKFSPCITGLQTLKIYDRFALRRLWPRHPLRRPLGVPKRRSGRYGKMKHGHLYHIAGVECHRLAGRAARSQVTKPTEAPRRH